jgi:hypothetical protein
VTRALPGEAARAGGLGKPEHRREHRSHGMNDERTSIPFAAEDRDITQDVERRRTHVAFARHAADLAARLELRDSAESLSLASQGRAFEAEFARWVHEVPPDERRVQTIKTLADWSRTAHDVLAATR